MKFVPMPSHATRLLWSLGLLLAGPASAALTPVDLQCEYAVNPLGIDTPAPRLFWKLAGITRGERQSAYEIVVSSSGPAQARNTGVLWDSGKVVSDETIQIPYSGKPLQSSQQVFWKVRTRDQRARHRPGANRRHGRWVC